MNMKKLIIKIIRKNPILFKIYKNKKSYTFNKNAKNVLEKLNNIFIENNLKIWLDYGTLLGAIREKDFIKHDCDIDLGIFYEEGLPKKIEKILKNNNINVYRELIVEDKILEQTFRINGVNVDIFYYLIIKDKIETYYFENNLSEKRLLLNKIINPLIELDEIEFKKMKWLKPIKYEEYLTVNYGKNYMIPNSNWDYQKDPKNIERNVNGKFKVIHYHK